ncbi:4174_t:CDS:2, partial [Entrophospora sp. SA101]
LRVKAEQLLDNAFPTFSETISSRTNGTTSNVSPLNVSPLGVKILSPVDTSMCCRWLLEKSNSPYALMFASARLKILYNALEACSNDTLSVTFLKFFLEFVNNRSTRLNFDISSPNGILIFRET